MDMIPKIGRIESEDGALTEGEQGIGAERASNSKSANLEHEIASLVSDLETIVARLDQLGLALTAARVTHAIDSLNKS